MPTSQRELRTWLTERLERRGIGASRLLATKLGVTPDAVTRMKNTDVTKECRRVEARHIPIMAEFFGEWPPGFTPMPKTPTNSDAATQIININAPVGTMVIGEASMQDDASLSITVTGDGTSAPLLDPAMSGEIDSLINQIATCGAHDAESVAIDLAKSLEINDLALIDRTNFAQAIKILGAWYQRDLKAAVDHGAVN